MSIPEFQKLSSIGESVMEPEPSPGSVQRVLLIHLTSRTKFYPPGLVLYQELSLLYPTPRTNFLVPGFDPELALSPCRSSPGQISLLQASNNFLTFFLQVIKGNGFLLYVLPCSLCLYEVLLKLLGESRILAAEQMSYNISQYFCVVVLTA